MAQQSIRTKSSDLTQRLGALVVCALIFAIRIWGLSDHFWLFGDQIRDWSIALGRFRELPLVGPPTHVHGYNLGPTYYWLMWVVRVVVGPWFDNLPHAGGVGQAAIESLADALLFIAVWRWTGSVWKALAYIVFVTTAAYDVCLSAIVWNPTVSEAFAKAATALVLLGWQRRSIGHVAVVAAVVWAAVHVHNGSLFVAAGVFTALLVERIAQRDWWLAMRNALTIAAVVVMMQLPYALHQFSSESAEGGMSAVTGSVAQVLSGRARPEFSKSLNGMAAAFSFLQVAPLQLSISWWMLLACAIVFAVRFRRDYALLSITVLPPLLAIVGYALFLSGLDHYFYLPIMPAVVLMVVLGLTPSTASRIGQATAFGVLLVAIALVPGRLRFAATLHKMPEYGPMVQGSRKAAAMGQPMRAIAVDFPVPAGSDPVFLYGILGGVIDPESPWTAHIRADGSVSFKKNAELESR